MVNLSELLKGTQLLKDNQGRVVVQTIQNMSLAFLTCPPEYSLDDKFADPTRSVKVSNRAYGNLRVENVAERDILVAPQIVVMNDYASQNHAMTKSGIVRRKSAVEYNDAGCIQGSQGGHINAGRENKIRFMPVGMREMALDVSAKRGEFSRLYPAVDAFGVRVGIRADHYLDRYFTKYDPQTSEFIAHFERPARCIGVVVMIDGEIVAIDKFPSFTYAAQVWDLLIRDCYGSLAIESQVNGATGRKRFTEKVVAASTGFSPVAHLLAILDSVEQDISNDATDRLAEVMTVQFGTRPDPDAGGEYASNILESDGYVGQVISSGEYHHLVSLVKRARFDPQALRKAYEVTSQYRELAQSQRVFSL